MADQFLGLDLSTQQLKAIVVGSDLKLIHEAKVSFRDDFAKYGTTDGVIWKPEEGECFAPVVMFLEALELVLLRLKEQGVEFSKIQGISGAGMQHGTVFWSRDAEKCLGDLNPEKTLLERLVTGSAEEKKEGNNAFSHSFSPNWQDTSTQKQCEAFDAALNGPENLAEVTGSSAHHRFSGPQIQRFREKHPEVYQATSRISLVSSFLASIFLGKIAPMDISDVCGANFWDIKNKCWHEDLLSLAAGGHSNVSDLKSKLGEVPLDGGASFGTISPYFSKRYGFPSSAQIIAFTGDNPSTMLALPLRASDAIVSLGTSTTFLMATPQYKPDPSYHFMNHPTTPGLYMFMLCYKNGSLAREQIRNAVNTAARMPEDSTSWDLFNKTALDRAVLGQEKEQDAMNIGVYFPKPEIVPNVPAGTWRFYWKNGILPTADKPWAIPQSDARAILESQFLSLRLRSQPLLSPSTTNTALPPQPRRVYLVGGGAVNPAIASLAAQVLGGTDGVYRLDIGGNACALGAAYKAAWGVRRRRKIGEQNGACESFEDFLETYWKEENFVARISDGYQKGIWEKYGEAVEGLREIEKHLS